jgi:hypothetical protein
MATGSSSYCTWYWNGSSWQGPLSSNCTNCSSTCPSNPPSQPGMVYVPCPSGVMSKKHSQCCVTFEVPIPAGFYLFVRSGSICLEPCIELKKKPAKKVAGGKKKNR